MKIEKDKLYYKAKARVNELKGFYSNLTNYLIVNSILVVVNLYLDPTYLWVWWVFLGSCFAVLIHGLQVFGGVSMLGKDWEDKKLMKIIEQEKKKHSGDDG